jgi:hypothetical protein
MSDAAFVIEWPLWGLRLDVSPGDPDQRIVIHAGVLYQPTWLQWEAIENSDVVQEYAGHEIAAEKLGRPTHSQPPVCMLRLSEVDATGEPDPTIGEQKDQARALVAALRLYSAGDFVDPDETGMYLTLPGGITHRQVEVFRSAFYKREPEDAYVVTAGDAENLYGLAHWVDTFRHDPVHTNIVLAIESFCLSFGSATSPGERSLHRFVALEAMLGSVHGAIAGASFAVRAAHAMSDNPDAPRWLAHAGDLRNRLAHDLQAVVPADDDLEMLEELTRAALSSYLVHVSRKEVSEADASHPLRSFNHALAAGPIQEAP